MFTSESAKRALQVKAGMASFRATVARIGLEQFKARQVGLMLRARGLDPNNYASLQTLDICSPQTDSKPSPKTGE